MASKQQCKYGAKCYRKNEQHLKDYGHPKQKAHEDDDEQPAKKKKKIVVEEPKQKLTTISDFFGKKKPNEKDGEKDSDEGPSRSTSSGAAGFLDESPKEDDEESPNEDDDQPSSPEDVKENIKRKFLVEMPHDFYDFWEFCKSKNSKHPEDAMSKDFGFQLVGPYDILAGKHKGVKKNRGGKRPNFLLHWRYYYDPPEFQTIVKSDDKNMYHLGYFRDDPAELPVFVGSNKTADSCIISPKGDNIFAAIKLTLDECLKSKNFDAVKKKKLQSFQEDLKDFANSKKYSLDMKTKSMKDRDKKVVCKTFHGAGMVVPLDENEVGYREVPEEPADLKKMFKAVVEAKSESDRDKKMEAIQELVTLVQFANDECDYGEGLELGLDLFSYGGEPLHTIISHLLPLAYQLLGRHEYSQIIEAHLKRRSRSANLSELE
ncbi:histone PARylation factor 1-like [Ylistrum balloti]|uniref:histone PARylation factor 1-like n=1 Tax=Ylistrum balloti TaxID=509963 RepID=UPI002905D4D7|nr:histone PARylation factor 1-like [Ylistrum balloti]